VLQSALAHFSIKETVFVFLRCFCLIILTVAGSVAAFGQDAPAKPSETPAPVQIDPNAKNPTAEQIAETVIVIYGGLGGRATLNQIRKTTVERGKTSVINSEGKMDQASYQRWVQRSESLAKEKVRLEQEFPNARYSLVLNDEKIYGLFNDSVFTPREDATKTFENQIFRGLEALLRYKENESKLELAGRDKQLGIEYHLIDVTDKQGRKTRFYVSVKRFRVMMLEYEDGGVKYKRKFYDYNYAQGTLVPFRTVLWADDKIVEESEVGTITFGQRLSDGVFPAS
jgi:hypothetical protein